MNEPSVESNEAGAAALPATTGRDAGPYQLFMLILCFFTLGMMAMNSVGSLDVEVRSILDEVDFLVCCLFLADFLYSLWKAPRRFEYFCKWGWLDLASSIPMIDALRWGRAARVLRIFRVLRGIRASRIVAGVILKRRGESVFLAAVLATLLVLMISSIGVLEFERDTAEANIKSAEDALWWSFVTMTTVGYGDRYPVTPEGRVVASLLMAAGVGLFGTFTGLIASWFVASGKTEESAAHEASEQPSELAELRSEVRRLTQLVETLANHQPPPRTLPSGSETES